MKRQMTFVQTAAVDAWQGESTIKFLWITECVKRHVNGDWGEVDDEDRATNEAGKDTGGMLMSVWPISRALPRWRAQAVDHHRPWSRSDHHPVPLGLLT